MPQGQAVYTLSPAVKCKALTFIFLPHSTVWAKTKHAKVKLSYLWSKFVTKEKYREVKSSRYVTSVKLEKYQEENCGD